MISQEQERNLSWEAIERCIRIDLSNIVSGRLALISLKEVNLVF